MGGMSERDQTSNRKTTEKIVLITGLVLTAALVAVASQLFGMYACLGESDNTCTTLSWLRGGMLAAYVIAAVLAAFFLIHSMSKRK